MLVTLSTVVESSVNGVEFVCCCGVDVDCAIKVVMVVASVEEFADNSFASVKFVSVLGAFRNKISKIIT